MEKMTPKLDAEQCFQIFNQRIAESIHTLTEEEKKKLKLTPAYLYQFDKTMPEIKFEFKLNFYP